VQLEDAKKKKVEAEVELKAEDTGTWENLRESHC
jgi:hypothetical protein